MTSDEFLAALDSYTHPSGPVRPDADTDQLQAFLSQAGDTDIVGLGEATHGTRELFELKHRLVRALVTECGVRTIAFETDFANTLALAEYVGQGTGTPAEALDELVLWVWKTEAIVAFLEWAQSFNDGRPAEDQIRVHGISLSSPDRPASALRSSLRDIEEVPTPAMEGLDTIADEEIPDDETDRETFFQTGTDVAETVRDHLDEYRSAYVAAGTERQWQITRHLCRHLEQVCAWNRTRLSTPGRFDPEAFEQRDRFMAENVGWCLDTDPGTGVVVWAHNTHVKRGHFDMDYEWADGMTMGEFLHREHGSEYRPYGTTFARGKFRAVVDDDSTDGPQTLTVGEPRSEAVTSVLRTRKHETTAGEATRFLDIESASEDTALDTWFEQTRHILGAPALVDPETDRKALAIETDLKDSFDGIIYFQNGSASQTLDTDR
jgi:erythromycin esterase